MNININLTKKEKQNMELAYHFGKMFLIGAGEGALIAAPFVKRGRTVKSKLLRLAIAEIALAPLNAAISAKETKNTLRICDSYEDDEKKDENEDK